MGKGVVKSSPARVPIASLTEEEWESVRDAEVGKSTD